MGIKLFEVYEDWAGGSRRGVFAFDDNEVLHVMGAYPNGWEYNVLKAASEGYASHTNGRLATISSYSNGASPASEEVVMEALAYHGVSTIEELWDVKTLYIAPMGENGEKDFDACDEISEHKLEEYVISRVRRTMDESPAGAKVKIHKGSDDSTKRCTENTLVIKWVKGTSKSYVSVNGKCMEYSKMSRLLASHINDYLTTHRHMKRGLELGSANEIFEVIGFC